MNTKQWMRFYAGLKPAECREMGELLIGLADGGPRDAVREARLQEAIAALPDPPDLGWAETLKQARLSAGERCNCGYLPKRQSKDQTT